MVIVTMLKTEDLASSVFGSPMTGAANQGQFEFRGVTAEKRYVDRHGYRGPKATPGTPDGGRRFCQCRERHDHPGHGVQSAGQGSCGWADASVGADALGDASASGVRRWRSVECERESGRGRELRACRRLSGPLSLEVSGPSNFYVKSQRLGNEDVLEAPLDLTGGAGGPLSIVLGISTGEVSGTVTSEDGTPLA